MSFESFENAEGQTVVHFGNGDAWLEGEASRPDSPDGSDIVTVEYQGNRRRKWSEVDKAVMMGGSILGALKLESDQDRENQNGSRVPRIE